MEEKDNFELWHDAGRQYAKDHPELELWDFQIETMASDFAWRMEGMPITPENVEMAYQDWISGNSPYSVHSRATPRSIEDGYDFGEQCNRWKRQAKEDLKTYLLMSGAEPFEIDKIAEDYSDLFLKDRGGAHIWKEWVSGKNPKSPHHIPLDPLNKQLRDDRVKYINERFRPKRKTLSFLFWVDSVKPPSETMMKYWLDTEDED